MSELSLRARLRIRRIMFGGRQPCCGATNRCCSLPPGLVYGDATGCDKCGHPKACHAFTWE